MRNRTRRIARAAGYGTFEAAQIFALWSLAVAQPLYDLLARNPEFLAVRGSSLGEVLLFAGGLSLLAPLLLTGLPRLAGLLGAPSRLAVHGLLVALLAAALVLNGAKRISLPASALMTFALLAGALTAWALRRSAALRSWAALLAISALVFPVVFFWRIPAAAWGGVEGTPTPEVSVPENPVPVVFIVFDELPLVSLLGPDGEVDATSFPNFAALARRATWFPSATTASDFTTLAIPALLTGRVPTQGQQPTLSDHPDNLFTLLAPHYEIRAQESLTRLCPPDICAPDRRDLARRMPGLFQDVSLAYLHVLLPAAWTSTLAPVDQAWKDFTARETLPKWARGARRRRFNQLFEQQGHGDRAADFLGFVSDIESPGSPPSLYFYASTLPHVPFDYLPSGRRYSKDRAPAGLVTGDRWGDDEWAIVQDHQRHLLQVGFVDRLMGLLIRRLRAVGLYDSSLLVVTADHGASFRPKSYRRTLRRVNFAEIVGVPLFLKLPGQRQGHRDERSVELIDVLPTILDVVGTRFPVDGKSLLAAGSREHQHRVVGKHDEPGTIRLYSSRELRRAIGEAVRLKTDRFGTEGFSTRFYQLGEFGNLVGTRVSDMRPRADPSIETELFLSGSDIEFDPSEGFVAAHITGTSRPANKDQRRDFAIAINGTIRAVTRTWKESPKHRTGEWSAVVDEGSFVPGGNGVEVFHLRPSAGGIRLARTDSVPPSPTRRTNALAAEM